MFRVGTPEACPYACAPDGVDCAGEPLVEPQPDIVEWEFDIGQDVTSDLGVDTAVVNPDSGGTAPEAGSPDTGMPTDSYSPPVDSGAVSSGGDSGCSSAGGHPAAGFLLLFLCAALSCLHRRRFN